MNLDNLPPEFADVLKDRMKEQEALERLYRNLPSAEEEQQLIARACADLASENPPSLH